MVSPSFGLSVLLALAWRASHVSPLLSICPFAGHAEQVPLHARHSLGPKGGGLSAYLQRMCVLPPDSGGVRGWSEVRVSGDESAFFAESFGLELEGGVLSFIRTTLAKRVLH